MYDGFADISLLQEQIINLKYSDSKIRNGLFSKLIICC